MHTRHHHTLFVLLHMWCNSPVCIFFTNQIGLVHCRSPDLGRASAFWNKPGSHPVLTKHMDKTNPKRVKFSLCQTVLNIHRFRGFSLLFGKDKTFLSFSPEVTTSAIRDFHSWTWDSAPSRFIITAFQTNIKGHSIICWCPFKEFGLFPCRHKIWAGHSCCSFMILACSHIIALQDDGVFYPFECVF